jgi:hypothetical protein
MVICVELKKLLAQKEKEIEQMGGQSKVFKETMDAINKLNS